MAERQFGMVRRTVSVRTYTKDHAKHAPKYLLGLPFGYYDMRFHKGFLSEGFLKHSPIFEVKKRVLMSIFGPAQNWASASRKKTKL